MWLFLLCLRRRRSSSSRSHYLASRYCWRGQVSYDVYQISCRFYVILAWLFKIGNINRSNVALMVFVLSDFHNRNVIRELQSKNRLIFWLTAEEILILCFAYLSHWSAILVVLLSRKIHFSVIAAWIYKWTNYLLLCGGFWACWMLKKE